MDCPEAIVDDVISYKEKKVDLATSITVDINIIRLINDLFALSQVSLSITLTIPNPHTDRTHKYSIMRNNKRVSENTLVTF